MNPSSIDLEKLTHEAESGDADAQYELGEIYNIGKEVPKNEEEALKWFILAENQDHEKAHRALLGLILASENAPTLHTIAAKTSPLAQYWLGNLYWTGGDIDDRPDILKDEEEAIKWYITAAKNGSIRAQLRLGDLYLWDEKRYQDLKEAVKWYELAAEHGDTDALLILSGIYYYGIHYYGDSREIAQDYEKSIKLLLKAAELGDAEAQFKLGEFYCEGVVVPQNYKEAQRMYKLAAEQGYKLDGTRHFDTVCVDDRGFVLSKSAIFNVAMKYLDNVTR
ncbi:MAG: sel1 repeat family protein [Candidatus Methanoplasma sp.]|jgi:TPR repeat protein|nr:sel1 repeat family protein [Candidatus Methanoplasma sp.]